MKWILLSALVAGTSFADVDKAPENFSIKNGQAVFVDFTKVNTDLTYNLDSRVASAVSEIEFEMTENGKAIMDLIPNAKAVTINGTRTSLMTVKSPNGETSYRLIDANLKAGTHKLVIENEFTANTSISSGEVKSGFWMSDLSDRRYIEQYLPTNIEYDQYQMTMNIKVKGTKAAEHEVFQNGFMTVNGKNDFTIEFPKYFTASSFYFHITKKNRFDRRNFEFTSITGKTFPVVVYTGSWWTNLDNTKAETIRVLKELESKLGAWPHPSLTVYVAGQGGMEHSGATITSMSALGHELIHSYFARGVMPVDGNSGWMDEAIASWRDGGYKAVRSPNFSSTRMSAHSQYRRTTDRKAYTQGANFMAFLNNELQGHGGLITFLNMMHTKYTHKNITTHLFKKELELFSGRDFTAEFNQYIFGAANVNNSKETDHEHEHNPYHPILTKKQLEALL